MTNTKLKTSINEEIRKNDDVVMEISKATGKSYSNVLRWFYKDSKMLMDYNCLTVISKYLGVPIEELFEETETEKV